MPPHAAAPPTRRTARIPGLLALIVATLARPAVANERPTIDFFQGPLINAHRPKDLTCPPRMRACGADCGPRLWYADATYRAASADDGAASVTALTHPDRALALVVEHAPAPTARPVPLALAAGLVLSEPITARVAQPPFAKSMMDGVAVRLSSAGRRVKVVGVIAAGDVPDFELGPEQCAEVMTGAPTPAGAEAVVKVEDIRRDGDRVTLPAVIHPGQHIQPRGALCEFGDEVLAAGSVLTPTAIGAAIAAGADKAVVAVPPALTLISTGNELAPPGATLGAAEIHDSNGPMLAGLARAAGAGTVRRLHAQDTDEALAAAINQAADADILVLTGGVSAGRYDLVPAVLARLGWQIVFHKTSQKPGKPVLFARRGPQLAFGLPGTPLGCHLGFHRYVATAIRIHLGQPSARPNLRGFLTAPQRRQGRRTFFQLARATQVGGRWLVQPLPWRGSSDVVGIGIANAYVRVDPDGPDLPVDAAVSFEFIDGTLAAAASTGRTPQQLHVLGRKNQGKTTLVVALIEALRARGLRVGALKHTSHAHELDTPGKDSHRHRLAGASPAAVVSADVTAVFLPGLDPNRPYDHTAPLFGGCDVVLVEGHATGPGLHVEVWRASVGSSPIAAERDDIIALISDDPSGLDLPHWPRSDVDALVDRLMAAGLVPASSR